MQRYEYNGPVVQFGQIIANRWKGTTVAASEAKAKSNLAYQYKRTHNKNAMAKITLPGEVTLVG